MILVGLFVRLDKIGRLPFGFEGDEVTWTTSSYFQSLGRKPMDFGVWVVIHGLSQEFPVSIKVNQLSFLFFGADISSPRYLLGFLSCISLILFYFISQEFFSSKIAWFSTGLFAFSAYQIILYRLPLQQACNQFFSISSIFLYVVFVSRLRQKKIDKTALLWLAGLITSMFLTIFSYNLSFLLPPIILASLSTELMALKIGLKKKLAIFAIALIPILIMSYVIIGFVSKEGRARDYAFDHMAVNIKKRQINFEQLKMNFSESATKLFFNKSNLNLNDMLYDIQQPLLAVWLIPFFLIGLIAVMVKFKQYNLLFFWFFSSVTSYQLLGGFKLPRMWAVNFPIVILIIGLGAKVIVDFFSQRKLKLFLPVVYAALIVSLSVYYYQHIFSFRKVLQNVSHNQEYRQAYKILNKHGSDNLVFLVNYGLAYSIRLQKAFYDLNTQGETDITKDSGLCSVSKICSYEQQGELRQALLHCKNGCLLVVDAPYSLKISSQPLLEDFQKQQDFLPLAVYTNY